MAIFQYRYDYNKEECLGNTVIYRDKNYTIGDVNEEEQLFYIKPIYTNLEGRWIRTENCFYIPF